MAGNQINSRSALPTSHLVTLALVKLTSGLSQSNHYQLLCF